MLEPRGRAPARVRARRRSGASLQPPGRLDRRLARPASGAFALNRDVPRARSARRARTAAHAHLTRAGLVAAGRRAHLHATRPRRAARSSARPPSTQAIVEAYAARDAARVRRARAAHIAAAGDDGSSASPACGARQQERDRDCHVRHLRHPAERSRARSAVTLVDMCAGDAPPRRRLDRLRALRRARSAGVLIAAAALPRRRGRGHALDDARWRAARARRRRSPTSTTSTTRATRPTASCALRVRLGTGEVRAARARDRGRRGGIEIQSLGRSLEIVKDLGDAERVDARHGISASAAPTAWATCGWRPSRSSPSPTATRSGPSRSPTSRSSTTASSRTTTASAASCTQEGYRFHTGNDSELIAVYLADKMSRGQSFYDALKDSASTSSTAASPTCSRHARRASARRRTCSRSSRSSSPTSTATSRWPPRSRRSAPCTPTASSTTDLPSPRSVFVWEPAGASLQEIV